MPGVLYHPNFEPSLTWLRSTLLVYDCVWSIVPPEAEYVPSDSVKRHLEKLPDSFATLAPSPLDIAHEYFVLRLLGAAFQRIRAESKLSREQAKHLRYVVDDYDNTEFFIAGITKLHDSKVAYTVFQMLNEFGLIYGQDDKGFSYVNEQAACLIIWFLAQRMATRLPMRTITDVDVSFYLSAACNVAEGGNPADSHGLLASSVLKFHIPENIGTLSDLEYLEIRKRYEQLREDFPLYLRDLGELFQIEDVSNAPELHARLESVVRKINQDTERIKRSQVGESIRRWAPLGIGCAVTIGAAFLPDSPSMKYLTASATAIIQFLTEALHETPIPGRLEGTQSLLLSAKEDIIDASEMARALDIRPVL